MTQLNDYKQETDKQANSLAALAMKTAAELAVKTAETNATINTNMEWVKKSLLGIEITLNEMGKNFVTATQHAEVLKQLLDHEMRIKTGESNNTKILVMLGLGTTIMSVLVSLLTYHLFQK